MGAKRALLGRGAYGQGRGVMYGVLQNAFDNPKEATADYNPNDLAQVILTIAERIRTGSLKVSAESRAKFASFYQKAQNKS